MSKNIVFCADGTWNGPGEEENGHWTGNPTNVFKLFQNLDGFDTPESLRQADEQERVAAVDGSVAQVAKYLHGVGDSRNPLVKLLGGAFGAGVIARVVRGYTFLSRHYAPGDRLYLVGFSRGAYTARALAGLVAQEGLMDARQLNLADKELAYRLGSAVWCRHQRQLKGGFLGLLESLVADLPGFLSSPPKPDQMTSAPMEAVAVWDTVGAMGIPAFAADRERIDLFRFADTNLSPQVACGLHAVSVDEARADFVPTFWNPDPRVMQVLFPGAHADVGGGYPVAQGESQLSDGALVWMCENLKRRGLAFLPLRSYEPRPDPTGPAHQPWAHAPWAQLPQAPREIPPGLCLHGSVMQRIAAAAVIPEPGTKPGPYAPANLEGAYLQGGCLGVGVVVVQ